MRKPTYLSPTALMTWEKNPEDYYLQYLADNRPPRFLQTKPMSVGSSFDAYVKSELHSKLFGNNHKDSNLFAFQTIFETQVEVQNRDWALEAGRHCFECYRQSGALADLMVMLFEASAEPRFEFSIEGAVVGTDIVSVTKSPVGLHLLGKPDVYFVNKLGRRIILDWKVNGYCSNSPKSPEKGYIKVRDGWKPSAMQPPSRNSNECHRDAHIMVIDGIRVNMAHSLEQVNEQWAVQLSTYSWLCGSQVGEQFIVALDQLACSPGKNTNPVGVRVAEHRLLISELFQHGVLNRYKALWETIESGYIFRDMTREESAARCAMLDLQYLAYEGEYGGLFDRGE